MFGEKISALLGEVLEEKMNGESTERASNDIDAGMDARQYGKIKYSAMKIKAQDREVATLENGTCLWTDHL